jgi:hypothetical protein
MEYDVKELLEKWSTVLDYAELPKIKDSHRRNTVAVLLENQLRANKETVRRDPTSSLTALFEAAPTNSMGASSSTAGDGAIDIYDPVLISLVRRSMPNLIAYDVCGVQPMTGPTGLIFALRSRYASQTGVEALFNEANNIFSATAAGNATSVTAAGGAPVGADPSLLISGGNTAYTVGKGMSTAAAEALGDGAGNQFQEMAMSIEKISVTATSRALKAEYTHELAQDLKAVHGLDAETELANILAAEVLAEINRQIIRSIYVSATIGAQQNVANAGTFDLDVDSNGRWMVEKFKGLLFQVEREANQIAKDTRMGKGNILICSSDVASAFAMAGYLDYQSPLAAEKLDVDDTGNTFAGTLFGRFKVYIDPYFSSSAGSHFVTVGYKGTSAFDAGMFYCPYVPLQMYKAVGENTFQPKIGFKTRYGLVAHPFATAAADGQVHVNKKNKYYRIFRVNNLM